MQMKLGIKVGLQGTPFKDLEKTHPDFCEIWFHSGKIAEYEPLCQKIQDLNVNNGLHFWGQLADGTQANLAYPDKEILKQSRDLVKKTIEAAHIHKSAYVNIHPGEARLAKIDFENEQVTPYSQPAELRFCEETLYESVTELASYAQNYEVHLYVESVPRLFVGHPWRGAKGRKNPVDIIQIQIPSFEPLFKIPNVYFTNDIGHTAGNVISEDRGMVKQFLVATTTRLFNQTKLLHVNYLIPPYNGTDYHGSIYYDEFKTNDSVPNQLEMQELLKPFINREDVGALVEPESDPVGNFFALKKLISEVV